MFSPEEPPYHPVSSSFSTRQPPPDTEIKHPLVVFLDVPEFRILNLFLHCRFDTGKQQVLEVSLEEIPVFWYVQLAFVVQQGDYPSLDNVSLPFFREVPRRLQECSRSDSASAVVFKQVERVY